MATGYLPDQVSRVSPGTLIEYIEKEALPYREEGCLIWPFAKGKYGQGSVMFRARRMSASRVVCILAHGEPPEAAHSCGNGHLACVAPNHLSWKTPKENQEDRKTHGTQNKPNKALDYWEEIKVKYATGRYTYKALALEYGIGASTVSRIINDY